MSYLCKFVFFFYSWLHLCIFSFFVFCRPSIFFLKTLSLLFLSASHSVHFLSFISSHSFLPPRNCLPPLLRYFLSLKPTSFFFFSPHPFLLVYIPPVLSTLLSSLLLSLCNIKSGILTFSTMDSSVHRENKELQCHLLAKVDTTTHSMLGEEKMSVLLITQDT